MRSRAISVMVAAVATAAALAQPARAAPLIDGVYRFAALKDGQCLVWPKLNGSTGMVSLGACTDNSATSANWRVRQRPNGTMEVSTPGSNPSTCLMVTTGHRVMISDNCADKYAEWTVSYGSAGPGSVVWADIEHTPGDHSGSWGKLLDTPDVIGRLVVKQTPVEPHYWAFAAGRLGASTARPVSRPRRVARRCGLGRFVWIFGSHPSVRRQLGLSVPVATVLL